MCKGKFVLLSVSMLDDELHLYKQLKVIGLRQLKKRKILLLFRTKSAMYSLCDRHTTQLAMSLIGRMNMAVKLSLVSAL